MIGGVAGASTRRDRGGFSLVRIRPRGVRGLGAWVAIPQVRPVGMPLVAVHGIMRRAHVQAELHAARAASMGQVVVAPHFTGRAWRNYQRIGRRSRPDLALLDLMRELVFRGLLEPGSDTRFALTGYSGGAQFAHRFAMLHPDRVARLTVTAAGWYTFPDAAPEAARSFEEAGYRTWLRPSPWILGPEDADVVLVDEAAALPVPWSPTTTGAVASNMS